jgi:hypothetical protein
MLTAELGCVVVVVGTVVVVVGAVVVVLEVVVALGAVVVVVACGCGFFRGLASDDGTATNPTATTTATTRGQRTTIRPPDTRYPVLLLILGERHDCR